MIPEPPPLIWTAPIAFGIGVVVPLLRTIDIPGAIRHVAHVATTRGPIRLEDMQDDIEASSRAWIDIIVRTSEACGFNTDEVTKFFDKVRVTSGCWYWTGSTSNGYGLFRTKDRSQNAHRWAWEFVHGPVGEGLHVDHVCHTRDLTCRGGRSCLHRRCVNPMHLEPVSPAENRLRGALHEMAVDKRIRRLQRRNKTHAWRWYRPLPSRTDAPWLDAGSQRP